MAASDPKCPVCSGTGKIHEPKSVRKGQKNRRAAVLLHKAGYSLREISTLLGYKSSRSAAILIQKKP